MNRPSIRLRNSLPILLVFGLLSAFRLSAQQLILSAPIQEASAHPRLPEVVELPLAEARKHIPNIDHLAIENAITHERLVSQLYTTPGSPLADLLLIAVQLPASGKLILGFIPKEDASEPAPLVFGREATERKDDYAWENEYVTYRVYGPALEATGEITSGIDVWSKRVPNLVIDRFYKHDAEGQRTHNPKLSYHVDDGVGLDSYLVGPSRGCGGTGVLAGNKLWVSKNYTHLKQISTGPVRFEFEMTYAPWRANGVEVTETKRITLDAGTHLNKITSTFTFSGPSTIEAAAGIAIHRQLGPAQFEQLDNGRILSVWDTPQNPTAGKIATGLVASSPGPQPHAIELENQALLVYQLHSGQSFTYYAGSGWSKSDMPTQQAWNEYLQSTARQLQHPLQIHWNEKPARHSRAGN